MARWIEQYRERPSERDISKQGAAARRIAEHHDDNQCARAVHGIVHVMPHSKGEPWDLFDLERKFAKAQASGQYVDGRTPSPEHPNVRFAEMYARALRH